MQAFIILYDLRERVLQRWQSKWFSAFVIFIFIISILVSIIVTLPLRVRVTVHVPLCFMSETRSLSGRSEVEGLLSHCPSIFVFLYLLALQLASRWFGRRIFLSFPGQRRATMLWCCVSTVEALATPGKASRWGLNEFHCLVCCSCWRILCNILMAVCDEHGDDVFLYNHAIHMCFFHSLLFKWASHIHCFLVHFPALIYYPAISNSLKKFTISILMTHGAPSRGL